MADILEGLIGSKVGVELRGLHDGPHTFERFLCILGYVVSIDVSLAGCGMDQIGKNLQGGALTGTVGSQKTGETVLLDLQGKVVDGNEVAVLLPQRYEFDGIFGGHPITLHSVFIFSLPTVRSTAVRCNC